MRWVLDLGESMNVVQVVPPTLSDRAHTRHLSKAMSTLQGKQLEITCCRSKEGRRKKKNAQIAKNCEPRHTASFVCIATRAFERGVVLSRKVAELLGGGTKEQIHWQGIAVWQGFLVLHQKHTGPGGVCFWGVLYKPTVIRPPYFSPALRFCVCFWQRTWMASARL